jgi:hypothetical protein
MQLQSFVFHFLARIVLAIGMAFLLGKTVPSVTNRVFRFVFLFVILSLFGFVLNYVDMRLAGYHKMSWAVNLILTLVIVTLCELFGYDSDTANFRR